jgi:hypothetical protein
MHKNPSFFAFEIEGSLLFAEPLHEMSVPAEQAERTKGYFAG